MITEKEKTLAAFVTEDGRTAQVFEKYGLDFCCKGKRTLADACRDKGLNSDSVLAEIHSAHSGNQSGGQAFPFDKLSPGDLCDYIVSTHHRYVKEEMPRIVGYAEKVAARHGEKYPFLKKINSLVQELSNELMPHLQKEESILFPGIKRLAANNNEAEQADLRAFIHQPIAVMERDHDHAGELMAQIRDLTHDYNPPADACTTFKLLYDSLHRFEQDLHKHVHLENNVLFPVV